MTCVSRNAVHPGESILVWSRAGDLLVNTPPSPNVGQMTRRSVLVWDYDYQMSYTFPADTPEGAYDVAGVSIKVVKRPKQLAWRAVNPGTAGKEITRLMSDGYNVEMRPGSYFFDHPCQLVPERQLRGYGAVIHRNPDKPGAAVYNNTVFRPAHRCVVSGLTVRGETPARYLFSGYPDPAWVAEDMTLADCTFHDGTMLGEWGCSGLVVRECRWVNSSAGPVYKSLWARCVFEGADAAANAAVLLWGSAEVAMVDCDWRNTPQGVSVVGGRGVTRNCLITGASMEGVSHKQNGCEGVGVEAAAEGADGFEDNMVLHYRYTGEGHGYNLWSSPAKNNLLKEFVIENGVGIELAGYKQPWWNEAPVQTGNVIEDGEVRGGCVAFATRNKSVFGNAARNVAVMPRATRGHQFHSAASGPPGAVYDQTDDRGRWLNQWAGVSAPAT